MDIRDRVIVVTGGGRGIGAAMCRRFSSDGARAVIVADRDIDAAAAVAEECGGYAFRCDVASEESLQTLIRHTLRQFRQIDVFCSNAGITVKGGLDCPNSDWQRMWDVNVMSRLFAARCVVPHMLERGEGYLLHTASAAGLLTEIGSASYSVTKHADVGLAEWLNVCYRRQGIRVSCICPLGVETDMLDNDDPIHRYLHLHAISADDVATAVAAGIQSEEFLILPHPEVAEFFALKSENYDRWLKGMQRLRQKLSANSAEKKDRAHNSSAA